MPLTSESFKHTARAPLGPAAPVVGYLHLDRALVAGVAAVVVEAGAVGVERGREAPLPHRRRPGSRSPLAPTAALRGRLSLEARLARPQTSAYWRILRAQLSSLGCCFRTSS